MDEGTGVGEACASRWSGLRLCNLVAQSPVPTDRGLQAGGGEGADGKGRGAFGADLLQSLQEPDPGHRAGNRDGVSYAGHGQIARLLSGDDLRRLPGGRALGQWRPADPAEFNLPLLQVLAWRTAAGFPRKLA